MIMKKILAIVIMTICSINAFSNNAEKNRDYYLIQVYHCSTQAQVNHIDNYLKETYLPFLHSNGIVKVGVFAPVDNDTAVDKRLFIWVPLKSLAQLDVLDQKIEALDPYGDKPLIHLENADGSLAYNRIESILTKSFKDQPVFETKSDLTKSPDRIYEYRSYESETENLHLRKVHMFNEGDEIGLFKRLHFSAVFYSKVIAGSRMPNLIYMTSFNNMEDRNAHWKAFGDDAQWKKISTMDMYKKTVSKNDTVLMTARLYADF